MSIMEKIDILVKRNYGLLIIIATLLAAILRFVKLGDFGLTDQEASLALQAFGTANGDEPLIGGQPGYVGLTSLLFAILEGNTFLARFWPAVFGVLLVTVPGVFRRHTGDLASVCLAFLIALDPALVSLSRSADGTMISIASLLFAIGLFERRKLIPAGIFIGLALMGSENIWPLVFASGLALILVNFANAEKKLLPNLNSLNMEKSGWLRLGLATLISALLVSSQFLLRPNGISGIGSSIVEALSKWQQQGEIGQGLFLLIILVTQFPVLILGIWGMVNGLREKSQLARFLGLWWIAGLLLAVINPSHSTLYIAMINFPLYVLSALQVAHLINSLVVRTKLVLIAEVIVTISLLIFSTLNFLNMINFPPGDEAGIRNRLIGTILPLALWIAFTILLGWGWDSLSTKSGIVLGLGIIFAALLIGNGWKAANLGNHPETELLVNQGLIVGDKDLLQSISDVSLWTTGQSNRIDVELVGLNTPSIQWALRNYDRTVIASSFPVSDAPSIVVSSLETVIQTQNLYRGQVIVWNRQPDYYQMKWQDWIKWFFNRDVPQKNTNILLWVRNDLFKDAASQIIFP